jgi:hypothetical protein
MEYSKVLGIKSGHPPAQNRVINDTCKTFLFLLLERIQRLKMLFETR